jgi:hypothetical protein
MKTMVRNRTIQMMMGLALILLMAASLSMAQEKTDEELEKKYSAILGEFEFDLTDLGGEIIVLNFHIDSGALWGDSGDGKPITLEPVEGEEYKFTSQDPDSGALEINFLKDDQDQYTICHIVLLDQGVEITGNKIK